MTRTALTPLPPGSTIGMLGGGQLGRMSALAAAPFGYAMHGYCPDEDCPLAQVSARMTAAAYDDLAALDRFAREVDVVTYEFENIPFDTVSFLAERVAVHPSPSVLSICQDRLSEKEFVGSLGIATAPFASAHDPSSLIAAAEKVGRPAVAKTRRMGYDGKGQVNLEANPPGNGNWANRVWSQLGRAESIVEGFVEFEREISVLVARGVDGKVISFPAVENRHANHILKTTIAPADVPPAVAEEAERIARRIAEGLDLIGLIGVEMFLMADGQILVNELAPRPHNSGHWTIDACRTSQFDQFIRAIAHLPLAPVGRYADAVMENLLGDEIDAWARYVADPDCRFHDYGKREARPGRKMGHVTHLKPLTR